MRSVAVVTYLSEPLADQLRQRAMRKRVSMSRYLSRLVESDADSGEVVLSRDEVLRRLKSSEDSANCIIHKSIDDLLAHIDRVANEDD
jgi:hypothetical protein